MQWTSEGGWATEKHGAQGPRWPQILPQIQRSADGAQVPRSARRQELRFGVLLGGREEVAIEAEAAAQGDIFQDQVSA